MQLVREALVLSGQRNLHVLWPPFPGTGEIRRLPEQAEGRKKTFVRQKKDTTKGMKARGKIDDRKQVNPCPRKQEQECHQMILFNEHLSSGPNLLELLKTENTA